MSVHPTLTGTDVHDRVHAVELVKLAIDGNLYPHTGHQPPRNYVPRRGDIWIYCQNEHKAARWVDGYTWTPSSTSALPSSAVSFSTCKQALRRFSKMPRATAMKKLDTATRQRVTEGSLLLEYFSEKGSILYDANLHLVRKRLKWRIGRKTWILVAYGLPCAKSIFAKANKSAPRRNKRKNQSKRCQTYDDIDLDILTSVEAQDSDRHERSTRKEEMSSEEQSEHEGEISYDVHYDHDDLFSDAELTHSSLSSENSPNTTYLPTPPLSQSDVSTQANLYELYPDTTSTNSTFASDYDTWDHTWMGRIQAERWLVWLQKNEPARYEHLLAMVQHLN